MQHGWDFPSWRHHRWEECVEVLISFCMVSETCLTLQLLGLKDFFRSRWNVFDFVLSVLTMASVVYALKNINQSGEIQEAYMPLLAFRFVLQPVRVFFVMVSAYNARRMQTQVDNLAVQFDGLPAIQLHEERN